MEIIIVKFNQPEYEKACIDSVEKFTDLKKHKLTVYDNYPDNKNLGQLWNELIDESTEDVICLLNSDTIVEEGWDKMVEVLYNTNAGAVGPVTDNCGGRQKNMTRSEAIEEINDLSGFCYLFRKEVWEEVGRFPADFSFYGQETVFNRKLEDRGYKLMVDRRVFIHHAKGRSWLAARDAGEISDEHREYGKMHYYNFIRRLKEMQKLTRDIVILGTGKGNPFPTWQGIDQFVSDFGGRHLPIDATTAEIGTPDLLIVVQSTYKKEWYDKIKLVKAKKKALYFMDLRNPKMSEEDIDKDIGWQWNCPDLTLFDKVFNVSKENAVKWEKHYGVPVEWLPQATIQHPIPPKGEQFKRVHIGGVDNKWHSNRNELLEGVSHTQLNEWRREQRIDIVNRSWGIYGSSDFSIAISPLSEGYTSDRLYHIMGSGGVAVALDPGGLEHLKDYGLWFKTKEEMLELFKQPQSKEFRKKAFEYIQTNHLYKDRIIKIIKNTWD